jgi:hypothetical protein
MRSNKKAKTAAPQEMERPRVTLPPTTAFVRISMQHGPKFHLAAPRTNQVVREQWQAGTSFCERENLYRTQYVPEEICVNKEVDEATNLPLALIDIIVAYAVDKKHDYAITDVDLNLLEFLLKNPADMYQVCALKFSSKPTDVWDMVTSAFFASLKHSFGTNASFPALTLQQRYSMPTTPRTSACDKSAENSEKRFKFEWTYLPANLWDLSRPSTERKSRVPVQLQGFVI